MTSNNPNQQFSDLFAQYERDIYRFVFSLVPNRVDADELVQDTLVQLWEHIDDYDTNRRFLPWAFQFAYRQVLMYRRSQDVRRRYFSDDVIELIAQDATSHQSTEDNRLAALKMCLKNLNEEQTRILRHRYEGGVSLVQLAKECGQSANALYKRIQRLRQILVGCVQKRLTEGAVS